MPDDSTSWYRVSHYDKDGKFVSVAPFGTWHAANDHAEELEKKFPEDDIQLWVRER